MMAHSESRGVEVEVHLFLTSALGGEQSDSALNNVTQYPLNRRLGLNGLDKRKMFAHARILTLYHSPHSLVTVMTMLSHFPLLSLFHYKKNILSV
jgi:hypothetical protein